MRRVDDKMSGVKTEGIVERMQSDIDELKREVAELKDFLYAELERRHLGDYEKGTGIYAPICAEND